MFTTVPNFYDIIKTRITFIFILLFKGVDRLSSISGSWYLFCTVLITGVHIDNLYRLSEKQSNLHLGRHNSSKCGFSKLIREIFEINQADIVDLNDWYETIFLSVLFFPFPVYYLKGIQNWFQLGTNFNAELINVSCRKDDFWIVLSSRYF